MSPINLSKALSEQNSLLPVRLLRGQAWLAGIVVLLLCSNTFAESDFSAFWQKLKAAVIAGDKVAVAEMTKFPLSMPYEVKAVKNKEGLSRRYNEIFKGEANAAQCFARGEPRKESAGHYEIYCPFKKTPEDRENAPIRFIFELTNGSWKFAGLDNVNE
jgi:hypothetical protein